MGFWIPSRIQHHGPKWIMTTLKVICSIKILLSSKELKNLGCNGSRLQFSPLVSLPKGPAKNHIMNTILTLSTLYQLYQLPNPVWILKFSVVGKIKLYTFWDVNRMQYQFRCSKLPTFSLFLLVYCVFLHPQFGKNTWFALLPSQAQPSDETVSW